MMMKTIGMICVMALLLSCNIQNNRGEQFFPAKEKASSQYNTGDVNVSVLKDSGTTMIVSFEFKPMSRNYWHYHPDTEQTLLVLDGEGFYQEEGQPKRRIKKGDVIVTSPNVRHWNGASNENTLHCLTLTEHAFDNHAVQLRAVSDDEYSGNEILATKKVELNVKSDTKKNIGSVVALYPTPVVVLGTKVNDKVNWMIASHVGIIGHDKVMVSMRKTHHTNQGVKENKSFTLNVVDENLLPRADYVGTVSGASVDKTKVFEYTTADNGMPMVDDSPLTMVCEVVDIYETDMFDRFICTISSTYAKESVLNDNGKVDYTVLKPVLFQMPTYTYLHTGDVIGNCRTIGKEIINK